MDVPVEVGTRPLPYAGGLDLVIVGRGTAGNRLKLSRMHARRAEVGSTNVNPTTEEPGNLRDSETCLARTFTMNFCPEGLLRIRACSTSPVFARCDTMAWRPPSEMSTQSCPRFPMKSPPKPVGLRTSSHPGGGMYRAPVRRSGPPSVAEFIILAPVSLRIPAEDYAILHSRMQGERVPPRMDSAFGWRPGLSMPSDGALHQGELDLPDVLTHASPSR